MFCFVSGTSRNVGKSILGSFDREFLALSVDSHFTLEPYLSWLKENEKQSSPKTGTATVTGGPE
jgi:hypothetical protein